MHVLTRIRSIIQVLVILLAPLAAVAQPPSATFDLAEHQGNVVVVDFWASWCVPCRRSFPWLNDMHAKYAEQGLVVVGVNLDASREDATAFLQEYPADFLIHFDSNAVARQRNTALRPCPAHSSSAVTAR